MCVCVCVCKYIYIYKYLTAEAVWRALVLTCLLDNRSATNETSFADWCRWANVCVYKHYIDTYIHT